MMRLRQLFEKWRPRWDDLLQPTYFRVFDDASGCMFVNHAAAPIVFANNAR